MAFPKPFRALLFFFLACIPGPGAQVQGQHAHHAKRLVREQIDDLEQQWRQAMLTGDTTAMDKLLSDDYLGITINGELQTKTQALDRMRTRELVIQKLDLGDIKIKVVGQIAIVTGLATVEGTSGQRPVNTSLRYTRVYQRVGVPKGKTGSSQWKITSFELTRVPRNPANPAPAGQ